jgi:hypothetical protein
VTAEFFRRYIDMIREAEDDMFATRSHPLSIAKIFDKLARGMMRSSKIDANAYQEVAQAFRKGMEAGLDAWGALDTMLREDSADTVEDQTGIDLYQLADDAEERHNQTPAEQAAAEFARQYAEWEAEDEADAPARAANEVKMWVVEKGKNKPQEFPQVEYDQREHPNFQKELAEFQEMINDSSWRNKPYEIKVTIGGKPVTV